MDKRTATGPAGNPRRIGRPPDSDPDQARQDILDAAEMLFADQGYAATSIREVAEAVGVNTALVHYYFGRKPQLLEAVFDRVLEPLAATISGIRTGRPVSLADFAGMFLAMAAAHPNLPRLITREVLLPGGQMRPMFMERFAPRLGGALPGIVAAQQQAGTMSNEFKPEAVALFTMSLCAFPFIAQEVATEALGIDYSPAGLASFSEQLQRFMERGLSP
jgi:AcrR family transcriptional regulator